MTTSDDDAARRFTGRLLLLAGAALLLRVAWLPGQATLADDASAAVSAVNFVERGQIGPMMWQHPRVRDLAVYVSTSLAGNGKLGLVLPSLLFGALAVPVVGLLGRRVAGDRAGLLAAFFLAIDPLHVDYSRQAVQEVYTSLFGAAGVLAALWYLDTRRARWAIAAGALFGLGLASKWSALFPLGVVFGFALWDALKLDARSPADRRANIGLLVAALVMVPGALYLATWAPWFSVGRGMGDWLHLQRAMALEATSHAGFNPVDAQMPHRAISWFLWPTYYADSAFGPSGPIPIIAICNPLTWLATVPAVAWLALRAYRERRTQQALLPALVLAGWLPFAVASRPIWLHSALAVLPFALIAVASAASALAGDTRRSSRRLLAYAAAVALVALPLCLLATGLAMDIPGLREVALAYRPPGSFEP